MRTERVRLILATSIACGVVAGGCSEGMRDFADDGSPAGGSDAGNDVEGAGGMGALPPMGAGADGGTGGAGGGGVGGMGGAPIRDSGTAMPDSGCTDGSAAGACGQGAADAGTSEAAACRVEMIPDAMRRELGLDVFYMKYADARGLPVVSSDAPADRALERVCALVVDMLSERDDVRQALIDRGVRFALVAESEETTDIPEFSHLPDYYNMRARGLGGAQVGLCAEESILCNTDVDRWRGEGICVHEYAHTISMSGLFVADPTFESRLTDAYEAALAAGLYQDTYAESSVQEYWAEGVQDWYNTNLESDPPNGVHNHVDTREELEEYDPTLYELIDEFLPQDTQFMDCYAD